MIRNGYFYCCNPKSNILLNQLVLNSMCDLMSISIENDDNDSKRCSTIYVVKKRKSTYTILNTTHARCYDNEWNNREIYTRKHEKIVTTKLGIKKI